MTRRTYATSCFSPRCLPSPADAEEMHVDVHTLGRDLSWLRRIVAEHGERCGLSPTASVTWCSRSTSWS